MYYFTISCQLSYLPPKAQIFITSLFNHKMFHTVSVFFSCTWSWWVADSLVLYHFSLSTYLFSTRWRSLLRHCATSRKVAGTIPDGVTGMFHLHNSSGHTLALGMTQPLAKMSTRNISWGVKAAGAQGWQPYHLLVPIVLKSGSLSLLEPSGPVQACNGIALLFTCLFGKGQQV
jgi:hypothetical protein